jgi:hypothetical protein
MLMSQRNTLMPAKVGATCGTTPKALGCVLDMPDTGFCFAISNELIEIKISTVCNDYSYG